MSEIEETKPWGDVMLASFLVWMVTFVGVFFVAVTRCCTNVRQDSILHRLVIPSFASGALLATCVFLLIPESLELLGQASLAAAFQEDVAHHVDEVLGTLNATNQTHIEEDHDHATDHDHLLRYLQQEEASHAGEVHVDEDFTWKFGAALLGGFLFPFLLHALFPPPQLTTCQECQQEEAADEEEVFEIDLDRIDNAGENENPTSCDGHDHHRRDEDCEAAVAASTAPDDKLVLVPIPAAKSDGPVKSLHNSPNIALALSIIVGDVFHNFTDGIFLGTAFLICHRDIGYTLVATTIYHELAQELADFIVLTKHCSLPVWQATLFNFLSGISIMIGGIVILAVDVTQNATGVILAISAGVYINITACECVPKILAAITQESRKEILLFMLCFVIGSIPIGLVLINHGHCEG